jgi:hypothetical protein
MTTPNKLAVSLVLALVLLRITGTGGATILAPPRPIDRDGLSVLVLYESEAVSRLPKEQAAVITGTAWMQAVKDAGGDYRVFDDDAEFNEPNGPWEAAMKKPSELLPRVIISNGRTGEVLPLPADNAAMLALVKKWGAK